MKRLICSLLCTSTLLTFAACKKNTPPPAGNDNSNSPSADLKTYIADVADKTAGQTSFQMTGSYQFEGTSVMVNVDGSKTETPYSEQIKYEMQVNGYGTSHMEASGSKKSETDVEYYGVTGPNCYFQKTDTDGTVYYRSDKLSEGYAQCEALAVCAFLRSLPISQAVQTASETVATINQSEGITTIAVPLSAQQFVTIYPKEIAEDTVSNVVFVMSVSGDGYCTGLSLSYLVEKASHEYCFEFKDFGVKQEIKKFTAVNAETWQKSFSPSSFDNVTVTRYYDDRTKENPSVLMINGAVSAKSINHSSVSSDGKTITTAGTAYYYQYGSQYFELEHGTVTNQDGKQIPHYKLIPTDQYKGETASSFASTMNTAFNFSGHYDDYTYDAESGTYSGTASDNRWDYSYTLSFENGCLSSIRSTIINKETGEIQTINSYYFTDYGTTEIAIPTK